jgi:hypothetical protein
MVGCVNMVMRSSSSFRECGVRCLHVFDAARLYLEYMTCMSIDSGTGDLQNLKSMNLISAELQN